MAARLHDDGARGAEVDAEVLEEGRVGALRAPLHHRHVHATEPQPRGLAEPHARAGEDAAAARDVAVGERAHLRGCGEGAGEGVLRRAAVEPRLEARARPERVRLAG